VKRLYRLNESTYIDPDHISMVRFVGFEPVSCTVYLGGVAATADLDSCDPKLLKLLMKYLPKEDADAE
jgi:hypothetical protein